MNLARLRAARPPRTTRVYQADKRLAEDKDKKWREEVTRVKEESARCRLDFERQVMGHGLERGIEGGPSDAPSVARAFVFPFSGLRVWLRGASIKVAGMDHDVESTRRRDGLGGRCLSLAERNRRGRQTVTGVRSTLPWRRLTAYGNAIPGKKPSGCCSGTTDSVPLRGPGRVRNKEELPPEISAAHRGAQMSASAKRMAELEEELIHERTRVEELRSELKEESERRKATQGELARTNQARAAHPHVGTDTPSGRSGTSSRRIVARGAKRCPMTAAGSRA